MISDKTATPSDEDKMNNQLEEVVLGYNTETKTLVKGLI
jgi:hypothetical protein